MPFTRDKRRKRGDAGLRPVEEMRRWRLGQAKAQLSEVVRKAAMEGPQVVTIHGREAAIVMAAKDYRDLAPTPKGHVPLVEFFAGLGLGDRSVHRETNSAREMDL